ncbi:MAG: MlaD family protein [Planctomycetes bacterium]|nr:MlaD family protein [Planctomycetota bacterium]
MVGGVRLRRHDRVYLVVFRESVSGLVASGQVEYKGVPVGIVRAIRLRDGAIGEVEVEVGIRPDVPIKADTRAQLQAQGITGFQSLQLLGGTAAAPDLPEGGVIPVEPSLFSALGRTATDLADTVKRLGVMAEAWGDDVQAALVELRATLVAGQGAARALEGAASAIGSEVQATGVALRATAGDASTLLRDPSWPALGQETVAAVQDLRRVAAALERAAAALAEVAGENRDDVRALVLDLRRTAAEARGAAREVRQRPSSLLYDLPAAEKPFPDPLPGVAR